MSAKSGTVPSLPRNPVWIPFSILIALSLILTYMSFHRSLGFMIGSSVALALTCYAMLLMIGRHEAKLTREVSLATEETEKLKLELDTVRFRTARLREELAAANSQARQSHQLTLLGRFTAGFLHEFNNPLAILTGRIEVLLEERNDDTALCADLHQMLKEARYMANISGTLLPALRRERGAQTFSPCLPADVLTEIQVALGADAAKHGVKLEMETGEVPPVNLPEHVLAECLRVLVSNAIDALRGRSDAAILMRIEEYHNPGAHVVVRVEDNGPGVPEELREHPRLPLCRPL